MEHDNLLHKDRHASPNHDEDDGNEEEAKLDRAEVLDVGICQHAVEGLLTVWVRDPASPFAIHPSAPTPNLRHTANLPLPRSLFSLFPSKILS